MGNERLPFGLERFFLTEEGDGFEEEVIEVESADMGEAFFVLLINGEDFFLEMTPGKLGVGQGGEHLRFGIGDGGGKGTGFVRAGVQV